MINITINSQALLFIAIGCLLTAIIIVSIVGVILGSTKDRNISDQGGTINGEHVDSIGSKGGWSGEATVITK